MNPTPEQYQAVLRLAKAYSEMIMRGISLVTAHEVRLAEQECNRLGIVIP